MAAQHDGVDSLPATTTAMKSRTPNLDAMAFVYEHKRTHESVCVHGADAGHYAGHKNWHHTATINPAAWIEYLLNHPKERKEWIEELCWKP